MALLVSGLVLGDEGSAVVFCAINFHDQFHNYKAQDENQHIGQKIVDVKGPARR